MCAALFAKLPGDKSYGTQSETGNNPTSCRDPVMRFALLLLGLVAICAPFTSAHYLYYYDGVSDCSGSPSVRAKLSRSADCPAVDVVGRVSTGVQFTTQISGCLPQGAESLSVSCFLNTASFAFYNGACSGTPLYQASSKSGACAPFSIFGSSYIVYCGDSQSPSPSPSPSGTPSNSVSATVSTSSSPSPSNSVSSSPYPSQSPCVYCHPWGQYGQNAQHTGLSTGPGPKTSSRLAWSTSQNAGVMASLSSDGFLYTACNPNGMDSDASEDEDTAGSGSDGGNDVVACAYSLRAGSPSSVWVQRAVYPLVNTQPAIGDNGIVFYAGGDHGLYGVDRFGGSVKFQGTECRVQQSPVFFDQKVYVVGTCCNGWEYLPAVAAYYETGSVFWVKYPSASYPFQGPAVLSNTGAHLFAAQYSAVVAVAPMSGGQQWVGCVPNGATPFSAPVVGADGTLYVLVQQNGMNVVVACNSDSGSMLWRVQLSYTGASVLALSSEGVLLASDGESVLGISARSGGVLWQSNLGATAVSFAAGSNGIVYAAMAQPGMNFYQTAAVNETDGSIVWVDTFLPEAVNGVLLSGSGVLYAVGNVNLFAYNY